MPCIVAFHGPNRLGPCLRDFYSYCRLKGRNTNQGYQQYCDVPFDKILLLFEILVVFPVFLEPGACATTVLLRLLLRDDDSEDVGPHLVSEHRFNLGQHARQVVPGGELTLEALNLGPVGAVLEPDVFDPLLHMFVDDRPQTFQRNFLGAGTVLDIRDSLGEGEDGLDLQDAGSDGGGLADAPTPLDIRESCLLYTSDAADE